MEVIYIPRQHGSCSHAGEISGIDKKNALFYPFWGKEKKKRKSPKSQYYWVGLFFKIILAPTAQNNRFVVKIHCDSLSQGMRKWIYSGMRLGTLCYSPSECSAQTAMAVPISVPSSAALGVTFLSQINRDKGSNHRNATAILPRNPNSKSAWCTHSKCFTKFHIV